MYLQIVLAIKWIIFIVYKSTGTVHAPRLQYIASILERRIFVIYCTYFLWLFCCSHTQNRSEICTTNIQYKYICQYIFSIKFHLCILLFNREEISPGRLINKKRSRSSRSSIAAACFLFPTDREPGTGYKGSNKAGATHKIFFFGFFLFLLFFFYYSTTYNTYRECNTNKLMFTFTYEANYKKDQTIHMLNTTEIRLI